MTQPSETELEEGDPEPDLQDREGDDGEPQAKKANFFSTLFLQFLALHLLGGSFAPPPPMGPRGPLFTD